MTWSAAGRAALSCRGPHRLHMNCWVADAMVMVLLVTRLDPLKPWGNAEVDALWCNGLLVVWQQGEPHHRSGTMEFWLRSKGPVDKTFLELFGLWTYYGLSVAPFCYSHGTFRKGFGGNHIEIWWHQVWCKKHMSYRFSPSFAAMWLLGDVPPCHRSRTMMILIDSTWAPHRL